MAMPNVYDEIFQYLKKYISENSNYSPKVLKDTPPSKYFPLVIVKEIRDVFDEHYGMNRKSNKQLDNADTDVYRWYMLYEAKVDENKRIYRR